MGVGIYFLTKKDDKVVDVLTLEKIVEELQNQKTTCETNLAALQTSIQATKDEIADTNKQTKEKIVEIKGNVNKFFDEYNTMAYKYYYIIKFFKDKFPTISYKYQNIVATPLSIDKLNAAFNAITFDEYDEDEILNRDNLILNFIQYSTEFFYLLEKEFSTFNSTLEEVIAGLNAEIANCNATLTAAQTTFNNLQADLVLSKESLKFFSDYDDFLKKQNKQLTNKMKLIDNSKAINDFLTWYDSIKGSITPEQNAEVIKYIQYTEEYRTKYNQLDFEPEEDVVEYVYGFGEPVYQYLT